MIILLAAALATCVPLAEADRFGDVRFEEIVGADDPRFISVECDQDGCTTRDRSGVEYRVAGHILAKTVNGEGPSDAFRSRLSPNSPSGTTLSAPVCSKEMGYWVTLDAADGPLVYGLFAQP